MEDVEDIKKLSPDKQVKKLAELIEKQKKDLEKKQEEIEEAEKLAKKAKTDTELQELQEKIRPPELDAQSSTLNELSDAFPQEDTLEATVKAEAPEPDAVQDLYKVAPDMATNQIYSDIMSMYDAVARGEGVSPEMAQTMQNVQYAMAKKQEDIEAGQYNATEKIQEQANTIKSVADKILGMYTGSPTFDKRSEM